MKKQTVISTIIVIAILLLLLLNMNVILDKSEEQSNQQITETLELPEINLESLDGTKAINTQTSTLEFEGHALGGLKSHVGTFDSWEATLTFEKGKLTSLEGTIQSESVNTSPDGVVNHLKSSDFFNSDVFPTIEFKSTSTTNSEVTGDLTFIGETQEITFPITLNENSISSEFIFDVEQFGFDQFGVSKDVDIKFNFIF